MKDTLTTVNWKGNSLIPGEKIDKGPITVGRTLIKNNTIYIQIKGVEAQLVYDIYYRKYSFHGRVRTGTKKQFLDILNNIKADPTTLHQSNSWPISVRCI